MTKSRLLRLPPELLQMVASHLDDTASISRLCRSNRHLYNALGRYLYRYDAVLASGDRCKALLATVAESTLNDDTRASIARKSLEAGADANICVYFYYTFPSFLNEEPPPRWQQTYLEGSILSAAVSLGCLPLVQVLVGFKADINRRTVDFGVPPIAISLLKMKTDVFLFLLRQPTIDLSASERSCENDSVLHTAIAHKRLDFVEMLMPYVNPEIDYGPWSRLLWMAVTRGGEDMVSFLLSCEKVNVNGIRKYKCKGSKSLEFIRQKGTVFVHTCRFESLKMMKLLHDHSRVDVDLFDKLDEPEYSPAIAAMMSPYHSREKVDFLIESSKCRTARDYIFRAACAQGDIERARKVVRLAEDHDKKHAKGWIKEAELYNLHYLSRSIREKWTDI